MGKVWPATAMLCFVVAGSPLLARAHAEAGPSEFVREGVYLSLYFVGMAPIGAWTRHPYAGRSLGQTHYRDDLDLFTPGLGGAFDLGYRTGGALSFALQVGAHALGTGEWEEQAARFGTPVSAHALQLYADAMVGLEVLALGPLRAGLHAGVGILDSQGGERLEDPAVAYDYSFLETGFDLRAGVELHYFLSGLIDMTALLDFNVASPGVERASGWARPCMGFQLAIGPRFWLDGRRGQP